MDEFLSEKALEEISQRCDSATPGPWISLVEGRDHQSGSNFIRTSSKTGVSGDDIELIGATVADQEFIAHCREDVPLLLSEIRRLRVPIEGEKERLEKISRREEVALLMSTLEAMSHDGVTAIVKIDGSRAEEKFTVVISGGGLGEDFFRKDGGNISVLLSEAVEFYKKHK